MINQVTMYAGKCDNCQEGYEQNHTGYCAFVDEEGVRDAMVNTDEWLEQNGKHYCPKCYKFDNEDKLMLNAERRKEPKIYSRDECVFHYCPSPDLCKSENRCVNG